MCELLDVLFILAKKNVFLNKASKQTCFDLFTKMELEQKIIMSVVDIENNSLKID